MAFSSIELWQQIAAARLASPQQCRSWATEVARQVSAADSVDGIRVLQSLVELGKLTDFQARALAGTSEQPLQRGSWSVRNIFDEGVWTGWWEVVRAPDFVTPVWARWLDVEQLQALRNSAPSLARPLRLAGLQQHPNLQRVLVPIRESGELQVLVEPVSGKLLSQRSRAGAIDGRTAAQLILGVARGLAEIHRIGLTHGRVLPDRIALVPAQPSSRQPEPSAAWDKPSTERRPVLLCDPLSTATAVPDRTAAGLLREQLGTLHLEQFIAPEFLAPGQLPSQASDVYSLGCTWYWLLTGQPPAVGDSPQQTLAQQIRAPSPLSATAAGGEEVARCLAHCLAKNLPARFASAIELVRALELALLPAIKQQVAPEKAQAAPKVTAEIVEAAPQPVSQARKSPVASTTQAKQEAQPQTPTKPQAVEPAERPHLAELPTNTASKPKPEPKPTPKLVTSSTPLAEAAPEANSLGGVPLRRTRRQGNPRLLIWSAGVCGFALLLLALLKFSGALEPSPTAVETNAGTTPAYRPKPREEVPVADPREAQYTIVDAANHLWIPPRLPEPTPIDLLPPGAELFVSCRPKRLLEQPASRGLLTVFSAELQTSLDWLAELAGQPLESIEQATIVGYDSPRGDGVPEFAVRFALSQPQPLDTLKEGWMITSTVEVDGQALHVNSSGNAYYVPQQPQADVQRVQEFSCGPRELMQGVAEFKGAAGPMTNAMEKLWRESDRSAAICIQASPRFLYTGGRGLLERLPPRLQQALNKVLNKDARGVLVKTYLEPAWYLETQVIGPNDRDAPNLINQLQEELAAAPVAVENWLVDSPPHPAWGAVAMRYPQMLRQFKEFSRYGIENGVAIMNAYLPTEGGVNLTSATWLAVQPAATMQAGATATVDAQRPEPLTLEQILERPIRLTFDQEPIEVALRLIAEEANADLPAGSVSPRFVLDGDAFELAGITRNQQLRDFRIENQPVRLALTEVAKRGNPVTTVTDTRQEDQKLIWVVAPDPQSPGEQMISLTTREAAAKGGIPLPREFAAN